MLTALCLALCAPPAAAQDHPSPVTQAHPPIISDSDFDSALPSLDQTTAPPPGTPGELPPTVTKPAATPETPATSLPPVTASDDSELDAPLPPLAGYDVSPLPAASAPVVVAQISYTTDVTGLKDAGVASQFKDLSALETGKGKAANIAMVRARASEDEALILRLLNSRGYFDATVTTTLKPAPDPNRPVRAKLVAVPGPLYHFGLVAIDANPTEPPDLIRNALPLAQGDAIVADTVLAAEANVSVVMQQTGYPFVKVGARDIALDPTKDTGDYSLHVDTGQRSRFGGFRTDGKPAFSAAHVGELTRFSRGELYDNRKVNDLRDALVATGLFRSVSVEPVATDQKAPDGSDYVDLLVHQQAGPVHTLAAEIGYSTGEGLTATGSWQNRNKFPPEGALILTGALGTQQQSLTTTFRRSNAKKRDRTFQLSATASHNIYDSYEAYTTGISGTVSRSSTPLWQKVWTWSYGFDVEASRESNNLSHNATTLWQDYYYTDFPVRIGYDRSNDLLNPTTGYRLASQTTPQVSLSNGGSNVSEILDASSYYPVGQKLVLAVRGRIGTLLGGSLADIAPSRRLYAGGGGSVRGFAYQSLGPKDASGNPTGGLSVVEASIEARYRIGDIGIVPFIDAGQAYASATPNFSNLRVGVGIGARLYTNFGPIRIDIATPLDRQKTEPLLALYVGIGQSF
ncbi:BamA/TamA family outer membrane protein [Asticcacaulis sp. EMRT-3]|uniref:BamA/TamA family outer membrane protein n=1 Tax=Asticcacaulis sp. EMRT-3 TaxID=3040349 RepID=UPI0024AFF2CC|nr:BamA/TamA family outer membrane protein [Asticcacaulis sp. EMRT-3]MDI7775066.1 BamA/TamA family outer membrane protein [Asticcacaulis sp. EMRT-3]